MVQMATAGAGHQHSAGPQDQQRRGQPEQVGHWREGRIEQHKDAVSSHDVVEDLLISIAGEEALSQQDAQIVGEVGVGFIDRLVLADKAAQLLAEGAGAPFERRIGEPLGRFDRMSRCPNVSGQFSISFGRRP